MKSKVLGGLLVLLVGCAILTAAHGHSHDEVHHGHSHDDVKPSFKYSKEANEQVKPKENVATHDHHGHSHDEPHHHHHDEPHHHHHHEPHVHVPKPKEAPAG